MRSFQFSQLARLYNANGAYFPNYVQRSGRFRWCANEDYDAADYQNMMLAFKRYLAPLVPPISTGNPPGHVPVALPSLHRPDLINYWYAADIRQLTSVAETPMAPG